MFKDVSAVIFDIDGTLMDSISRIVPLMLLWRIRLLISSAIIL